MKKILLYILLFAGSFSCRQQLLEKPENLIERDTMVDLYFDISVLNAAKSSSYQTLKENQIIPTKLLYQKYQIDSLQFTKSNAYYLSQPQLAQSLLQEVKKRLDTLVYFRRKELDSIKKIKQNEKLKKVKEKMKKEGIPSKNKKGKEIQFTQ
ncbi:MAG: DUF4296 domain-containing protein [Flavobacteriaceae bacterium]|nr:DUF4296 domain-containing protein [Flavobacteriaceae bacterium]